MVLVMKKTLLHKYIGYNGILVSKIHLETSNKIDVMELKADNGKILTNGEKKVYCVTIIPEEIEQWIEIDDIGQEEII